MLVLLVAGCGYKSVPEPLEDTPLADPGEGASAKREEGKVGVKDLEVDRQIAETAGVLGASGTGEGSGGLGTIGHGSGEAGDRALTLALGGGSSVNRPSTALVTPCSRRTEAQRHRSAVQ